MAYLSEEYWTSGNITVPSGCTAFAIFTFAFSGAHPTAITVGGVSPDSSSYQSVGGGYFDPYVGVWLSPTTGSRALSITWSSSPLELLVAVVYLDGSTSIRDIDTSMYGSGNSVTIDSNSTDLVLGFSSNYYSLPSTPSGWTSRTTGNDVDTYVRVLTADTPGASSTTLSTGTTGDYYGVGAVSFIASTGGASAVPAMMRSYRARRN